MSLHGGLCQWAAWVTCVPGPNLKDPHKGEGRPPPRFFKAGPQDRKSCLMVHQPRHTTAFGASGSWPVLVSAWLSLLPVDHRAAQLGERPESSVLVKPTFVISFHSISKRLPRTCHAVG